MIRTIYLHGALGRKFGFRHRLAVKTVAETIRALSALRRGFHEYFFKGPGYAFIRGATTRDGAPLEIRELLMTLGTADLHIMPAAEGAKGRGKAIGKIVLGVAMVGLAIWAAPAAGAMAGAMAAAEGTATAGMSAVAGAASAAASGMAAEAFTIPLIGAVTYGRIAMTGAMMALGGVSQLLSPTPKPSNLGGLEAPDQRASFLYNGSVNTVEQGGPVPVVYGRMRVGSTLISGGISIQQIDVSADGYVGHA